MEMVEEAMAEASIEEVVEVVEVVEAVAITVAEATTKYLPTIRARK
jgi:hypothetical protein